MRIGIDANPMFIRQAGIGQYVANLITHMVRLAPEDEFVLYRTGMWGELKTPTEWGRNVRVVSAPKLLLRVRSRLDELDVYHGTSYRLRGIGRRGSIVSIHDLAAERMPGIAPRRWGARLASEKTRRTVHRATLVVVPSEHAARDVSDLMGVPREKIEIINQGVGDDYFPEHVAGGREALCRRYALRKDRYVLFVGTLDPRKNVPTLVRAFGRLTHVRRSHCLVLVGAPGQGIQEIADVVRGSGLDEAVVMPGYLPPEEVRRLYSYADLFVYPSLYEGFGLPPLEAMACGTPTITSNTSSLPEVVGEAALQVDPLDPEVLADAMNTVLEDQALAAMLRARGFERAKRFSWEGTARKTLQAYHRVAGR